MATWEIIGTVFALLGVVLTTQQVVWCWPVSIVATVIYIYIFYESKIYGDSALQVFYLAMSFYGWYEWLYGGKGHTELTLSKMNLRQWMGTIAAGAIGTVVLAFILKKTDTNVPWLDATTTSFSLVATWMMARKMVENWLFWVVIDAIYIGVYIYKDLNVTAFQYFVFTVLAAFGYWQWNKELQKAQA